MLDVLLASPAFGFYCVAWLLLVFDAAKLIFINETVFYGKPGGQWNISTPVKLPSVARRFLFMPNPLRPSHVAIVRAWPETKLPSPLDGGAQAALKGLSEQLWPARWSSNAVFLQLFMLLPPVYWIGGVTFAGLLILALYLQIALALVWLSRFWRMHRLGWPSYALVCFECLICLPYAANMYRRAFNAGLGRTASFNDLWVLLDTDTRKRACTQMRSVLDQRRAVSDDVGQNARAEKFLNGLET